jgi:uncharacterized protein YbjT (DUF2867 family)
MILVTGATGSIGRHVVIGLRSRGEAVRALVRTPEKAALIAQPGVEIALGDLGETASIAAALAGVDRLFLLVADARQHLDQLPALLNVCQQQGVRYLVNLSMWGAEAESAIGFAQAHWQQDQAVAQSGLPFVHLRPNLFMQNFLRQASLIASQGQTYFPMGDARVSLIDVRDIAAVVVGLLTAQSHAGETLILTGGESLTYAEATAQIGAAIGRETRYINQTLDEARASLAAIGLRDPYLHDLIELYRLFGAGYGAAVTNVVAEIAQRPPIPFAQFARDHAAIFRSSE